VDGIKYSEYIPLLLLPSRFPLTVKSIILTYQRNSLRVSRAVNWNVERIWLFKWDVTSVNGADTYCNVDMKWYVYGAMGCAHTAQTFDFLELLMTKERCC